MLCRMADSKQSTVLQCRFIMIYTMCMNYVIDLKMVQCKYVSSGCTIGIIYITNFRTILEQLSSIITYSMLFDDDTSVFI